MIEVTLRTGPPYSPEYTREAGRALAECVRVLNHQTHPANEGGLRYPGDVYELLGSLCTAAHRLPQLFDQLGEYLRVQAVSGHLGDSNGADPEERAALAMTALADARRRADQVTRALQSAQNAISGLFSEREPSDD